MIRAVSFSGKYEYSYCEKSKWEFNHYSRRWESCYYGNETPRNRINFPLLHSSFPFSDINHTVNTGCTVNIGNKRTLTFEKDIASIALGFTWLSLNGNYNITNSTLIMCFSFPRLTVQSDPGKPTLKCALNGYINIFRYLSGLASRKMDRTESKSLFSVKNEENGEKNVAKGWEGMIHFLLNAIKCDKDWDLNRRTPP